MQEITRRLEAYVVVSEKHIPYEGPRSLLCETSLTRLMREGAFTMNRGPSGDVELTI
ncbi:hypothetical protein PMI06_003358 [Burkholderia sp. BT03]|nr:hypothetical protein PMI06_003358 [Burkholderia sp. BT03]SKC77026.1 hypothetical protein SAMN06266956_3005 [Paraburkholderia hospita]